MLKQGEPENLPPAFPCTKCGAEILIGQQVCNNCGEQFEYRCANCGMIAATISGFCINCGGRLHQHTQPAKPPTKKTKMLYHKETRAGQQKQAAKPLSKIGIYFGLVAIILCILGALYFVGTGAQGDQPKWLGSGFIFQGTSPPSTPSNTTPPNTVVKMKPAVAPDSPRYSAEQVTAIARNQSPVCRAPAKRVG